MQLEFTILVVVIVIVWGGLFSLPIVFYYEISKVKVLVHASQRSIQT